MKSNIAPAPSASLTLVRTANIDELLAARYTGIKLGPTVLAPAPMVEAEIERRRSNSKHGSYLWQSYAR